MTPAVPFLLDLGRWLLECAAKLIAYTALAGILCFLVGVICGIVVAAKDPPSWLSALAERAAPQAKPKPEHPVETRTSNTRWPADAARRH